MIIQEKKLSRSFKDKPKILYNKFSSIIFLLKENSIIFFWIHSAIFFSVDTILKTSLYIVEMQIYFMLLKLMIGLSCKLT